MNGGDDDDVDYKDVLPVWLISVVLDAFWRRRRSDGRDPDERIESELEK